MTATEISRAEFERLEQRVDALAHEVEGEKLVSRYILKQTRQNGDDLAAVKTRVDRIEEKIDRIESGLRGLRQDFSVTQKQLPGMIAEVLRDVLRGGGAQ
jgi:tetrahydromethanopterin S-methyltransferase subunit G